MTAVEPQVQFTYYSKKFFTLAEVWPRAFLAFPSKEVRGLTVSKSFITILNISKNRIVYRIVKHSTSKLTLRVRPFMGVIAPGFQQTIEVVVDSGHTPQIDDKLYVEVVEYGKDIAKFDKEDMKLEMIGKDLKDMKKCFNTPEFYCYSLYETKKLALIAMQEQVFNLQRRLETLEVDVCTFTKAMASKAWLPSLALMVLIFLLCFGSYFWFSGHRSLFETSDFICHCGYNVAPSVKLIRNLNWFQKLFIK